MMPREHCWHSASIEYLTYPSFHYETCCWCGKKRRVGGRLTKEGHGPFLHSETILPYTEDVGPCIQEDTQA